jgi:hypothetical protein
MSADGFAFKGEFLLATGGSPLNFGESILMIG